MIKNSVYQLLKTLIIKSKKITGNANPKEAGSIIYAELGNAPKKRPMVPPPSLTEQSVITQISKHQLTLIRYHIS